MIIINMFAERAIAGLCNGSTPDSDSVCEGSNPSPAAKRAMRSKDFMALLFLLPLLRLQGFRHDV